MRAVRLGLPLLLTPLLTCAQQEACSPLLLFASDTQEPMRVERLFLPDAGNRQATRALFDDMLAQPPTDLFLLGDLVNLGYNARRWALVDTALAKAMELGFRVHAILGNHEVMGRARAGERMLQTRFPEHVRTGYSVQAGEVLVVLLNSNFGQLTKADIAQQQAWYARTLAEADSLPGVRTVIVCCHHSPYSHSKLVGSSEVVQERFVAPFMAARKTSLFISGHAHMFQHFQQKEKHFYVIGGGGGLHHPRQRDPGPEVCLEPDYDPLFHYLTVRICGDHLEVVSRRLLDDHLGSDAGCEYTIPLPSGDSGP